MAWIESHQSLPGHRKTARAVRLLKVNKHKFIGHLIALWWWGLDNADPNGVMRNTSALEIADGAGWPTKQAEAFTEALVSVNYLEEYGDGYRFHNWEKYTWRFYDWQDKKSGASTSGKFGNHQRWHVDRGITAEDCEFCQEPSGEHRGANRPDIASESLPSLPPSDPPTILPTVPTQRPDATKWEDVLKLSDVEWRQVQQENPGVNVIALWRDWVSWIRESEGAKRPEKSNLLAFQGFLRTKAKQVSSAAAAREVMA